MKTTKQLAKLGCVLLVMVFSCLVLTACGRSIKGTYVGEDGSSFEFTSDETVRMYNESKSNYVEGTYYWDKDDNCYYMNFSNSYFGNMHYKTTIDGNKLTISISGHDWIYTKK